MCEGNFYLLKKLLISAPIFKIVDPNEDFVARIDACKERPGGVLTRMSMWFVMNLRSLRSMKKIMLHMT